MNKIKDLFHTIIWWTYYTVKDWKYSIKWAYQRVFRGYDDVATWNLESYLAEVIRDVTFKMAEDANGYPDEVGSEKKWREILHKISFGFGSYIEMRSGYYYFKDKEYKRLEKDYKKGMELFAKYFGHLWD